MKQYTWNDSNPNAPQTPWGPAQAANEIGRGVRFYHTAGHGGLCVSRELGRKELSGSALKRAEFYAGSYWFEEDSAISVVLFEKPDWALALRMKVPTQDQLLREHPKYFTDLASVLKTPKLAPGLVLELTRPVSTRSSSLQKGDKFEVVGVKGTKFVASFGGVNYSFNFASYYDPSDPLLIPAD